MRSQIDLLICLFTIGILNLCLFTKISQNLFKQNLYKNVLICLDHMQGELNISSTYRFTLSVSYICRIYNQSNTTLEGGWIVLIKKLNKLLAIKEISTENTNANTRELSWFGPCDLHLVPKQNAWDFPFFTCVHPQPMPCTPLDKHPLPNVHNSSLHQREHALYNFLLLPRRRLVQNLLWMNTMIFL